MVKSNWKKSDFNCKESQKTIFVQAIEDATVYKHMIDKLIIFVQKKFICHYLENKFLN